MTSMLLDDPRWRVGLLLLSLTCHTTALSGIEGAAKASAAASYSVAALSNSTSLLPHSRRRRSILFPEGSDLSFKMGVSIPISALSDTSECPPSIASRSCSPH